MSVPWLAEPPVPADAFREIRLRAIFDCCKWDPQNGDVSTLSSMPVVLKAAEWLRIASLAERLSAEAIAAEAELAARPELHEKLGLPRSIRKVLRRAAHDGISSSAARVMRFDFHFTRLGWKISEANTDVPGGFNEASGFTRLVAPFFEGTRPAGDPAEAYAEAVSRAVPGGERIAMVHATAYSDDRQVMAYLARSLEARGLTTIAVGPDGVRWRGGDAFLNSLNGALDDTTALGLLLRFFPAEWLPNLPRASGWSRFFGGARTPLSNPAAAVLTQSKRFPLAWDALRSPLETWRELLPETRDPRDVPWERDKEWVLKPALGRMGDSVAIRGVTPEKAWGEIARSARRHPGLWAAQRRFEAVPLEDGAAKLFPCIGVYAVDGRAAGAYGRLAQKPLIDGTAQDAAVLVREPRAQGGPET